MISAANPVQMLRNAAYLEATVCKADMKLSALPNAYYWLNALPKIWIKFYRKEWRILLVIQIYQKYHRISIW